MLFRLGAHGVEFKLGVSGTDSADRLLPLSVDISTGAVSRSEGELLLGALSTATSMESATAAGLGSEIERAEELAFAAAIHVRRDLEADLTRSHADRVLARRASIRRQFATRIAHREATLSKLVLAGRSPQIIRLKEGEIRRLKAELDQTERDLTGRPDPTVDLEPIAFARFLPNARVIVAG